MCKIICVSNRNLCKADFTERIQKITDSGIPVILREKDLSEDEYYNLLCKIDRKEIIAHNFPNAARKFGAKKIHLPLHRMKECDVSDFETVGVSTHSVDDALQAFMLGADYITAGHIFATDCKKGVPPKGVGLIRDIKNAVALPVLAIGGISPDNAYEAIKSGASGVCVMSGFMKCENAAEYAGLYKHILEGTN